MENGGVVGRIEEDLSDLLTRKAPETDAFCVLSDSSSSAFSRFFPKHANYCSDGYGHAYVSFDAAKIRVKDLSADSCGVSE